jgi:hypothetical protein
MRLTGTLVLVLGVFAFAGSAYAGNGNGNGNGKGNEGAAPGNSGNAPGQVKKQDDAAATPAPAATSTTAPAAAPTTTAATNSTGVKPANDTAHDTHAEAQSDKTKQYGNGQTAGQIAEKNGAAGNDVLHGPGNSQPHKATPCSGGRHEVDVHALKSHRSGSCDGPAPTPTPTPTPNPHPNPNPNPKPDPGSTPNPGPPAMTTTTTAVTTTTTTPGTTTTPAGHHPSGGATEGVLSATQRVGHAATLPFTGQRLWLVVLLGVILILTGLALREIRTAEAPVESGHDHTDRSRHAAHGSGASLGGRPGR